MGNYVEAVLDKESFKMQFIVRQDLQLSKSEIANFVAEAVINLYEKVSIRNSYALKFWKMTGQPKIALKIKSEKEILKIIE